MVEPPGRGDVVNEPADGVPLGVVLREVLEVGKVRKGPEVTVEKLGEEGYVRPQGGHKDDGNV